MPSRTARTARLRSAAWAAGGNDRVSSSVMPAAYDTITPFAYRGDNWINFLRCHAQPPRSDPAHLVSVHGWAVGWLGWCGVAACLVAGRVGIQGITWSSVSL